MNKGLLILPVLLMFAVSSCKLVRKPSRKNISIDSTTVLNSPIGPEEMSDVPAEPTKPELNTALLSPEKVELISRLMPLWNNRIDFRTFKGKAKMHYEGGGMKQDFTANIRMAKDSVIWVHITAGMGLVNVARVYITPDSFQLVNYLDKSGMSLPIAEAKQLLPASVDFGVLQNLLIGDALSHNGIATDATDFGGTWSLDITDPEVKQQVNYNKADSSMRSLQVLSLSSADFAAMIQYGNYSVISSRKFAISRAINITSNRQQHYLDMNFNNASFDEVLDYPFSIPESYSLNK